MTSPPILLETARPQVVDRGDGTYYRARLAPAAVRAHLCGEGRPGILVLRCHDLRTATEAARLIDPAFDFLRARTRLLWVRYVPEYDAYERELRGTAGATPAVLFDLIGVTE